MMYQRYVVTSQVKSLQFYRVDHRHNIWSNYFAGNDYGASPACTKLPTQSQCTWLQIFLWRDDVQQETRRGKGCQGTSKKVGISTQETGKRG